MDHLIDDDDRLKPCPFCGGEAEFNHDENGWNWIECLACGASTNARVSAMDDAQLLLREQWNKRVPPACGCREGERESKPVGVPGAQPAPTIAEQDQINAEAAIRSIYDARLSDEALWQTIGNGMITPAHIAQAVVEGAITPAYITQPAPSVPDGWKLVPIEPTEKMINEGTCASTLPGPRYIDSVCAKQCWVNMLAAAPEPETKP